MLHRGWRHFRFLKNCCYFSGFALATITSSDPLLLHRFHLFRLAVVKKRMFQSGCHALGFETSFRHKWKSAAHFPNIDAGMGRSVIDAIYLLATSPQHPFVAAKGLIYVYAPVRLVWLSVKNTCVERVQRRAGTAALGSNSIATSASDGVSYKR
nr:hypothetical protein CFP56_13184 [Quercus suber]